MLSLWSFPCLGDVNPIFVLEAKLAMMLRIAQTETGGKRLIQAGFLKTLASCDFISRQPYLEDMDCESFSLPRVIFLSY
jgi:nuclear pore complex protein Nup205